MTVPETSMSLLAHDVHTGHTSSGLCFSSRVTATVTETAQKPYCGESHTRKCNNLFWVYCLNHITEGALTTSLGYFICFYRLGNRITVKICTSELAQLAIGISALESFTKRPVRAISQLFTKQTSFSGISYSNLAFS